jgi:2-polyprenyl-6-methoxyphenol hydroxylase-like FAD-dependent oxidoreductase
MSGPSATGGAPQLAAPLETDAVVIGAGPVGLFQVFQLGLLEIRTHLVDALPAPGGQPAELYPDKPIYDVPGVPVCTGRELTASLLRQIAPFQVAMHLGQAAAADHLTRHGPAHPNRVHRGRCGCLSAPHAQTRRPGRL